MPEQKQTFKCPKCGFEIPVTEALTGQIEQDLSARFEARLAHERKADRDRIERERAEIEKAAGAKARESIDLEMKYLQEELKEKAAKLDDARRLEFDLRRRQRDLEEKEREIALAAERKLDEERAKIFEQAAAKVADEHQLKMKEKELVLEQMRRQIEELKKRADQGPQERQGEVQELVLEDMLASAFPLDEIEPVAKGKRGGDIIHRVKTNTGQVAGTILWESKRTKNWSDGWIAKLKDDQREKAAEAAVIVSDVLPAGEKGIGCVDGVWVSDFGSFLGLALALRQGLTDVWRSRNALIGQQGKMEQLYEYLTGVQFRQRIEAIVESFKAQKSDLEAEKAAMQRSWAKRDKQIGRILSNTAGIYGDFEGIIGKALPAIAPLELPGEGEGGKEAEKGEEPDRGEST